MPLPPALVEVAKMIARVFGPKDNTAGLEDVDENIAFFCISSTTVVGSQFVLGVKLCPAEIGDTARCKSPFQQKYSPTA